MTKVLLVGPALTAVSGVSTHLNLLLSSRLGEQFRFLHFQVGSEGRAEQSLARLWRFLSSPLALLATLVRRRPDVVHFNSSMDRKAFWRDLVYVVIARAFRIRVVLQVHGGDLPGKFCEGRRFRFTMLRLMLKSADAVVVLSQLERRAFETMFPWLRVAVVPNAVPPQALAYRSRAGPQSSAVLQLAYVGRLAAAKGVFEAVRAVAQLRQAGIPVRLSIAGAGPDEASLRAEVRKSGLEQYVSFLGVVVGEAKTRLWVDSDVFVLPTHGEGLPYALLESMAAGVVPVTCPVGAIPEVVQDGVEGLLVAPGDVAGLARAIRWLYDHQAQAIAMRRAAQARIRRSFAIDRLVADFVPIYRGSQGESCAA